MEDFRNILRNHLDQRTERNPRYSLRAFARDLELSPSYLSEIMNGKSMPSRAAARQMCRRMQFGKTRTEFFCDLIDAQQQKYPRRRDAALQRLAQFATEPSTYEFPDDVFRAVADWYHLAILALFETEEPKADPVWIAARLQIEEGLAALALDRLERLGLIEYHDDHVVKVIHNKSMVSDGVAPEAMRMFHHQALDQAIKAMETRPRHERLLQAKIMAVSKAAIPRLNEAVLQFHKQVSEIIAEYDDKTDVYLAATQLVPLSVPGQIASPPTKSTIAPTAQETH